jgi:hypothetical protein
MRRGRPFVCRRIGNADDCGAMAAQLDVLAGDLEHEQRSEHQGRR